MNSPRLSNRECCSLQGVASRGQTWDQSFFISLFNLWLFTKAALCAPWWVRHIAIPSLQANSSGKPRQALQIHGHFNLNYHHKFKMNGMLLSFNAYNWRKIKDLKRVMDKISFISLFQKKRVLIEWAIQRRLTFES